MGGNLGVNRSATTDERGEFQIEDLRPGVYRVSSFAPGYYQLPQPAYHRPGDIVNITFTKGSVITGTVTDAAGDPVVAVRVRATRVRDAEGKLLNPPGGALQRETDDRRVYRLYGLQPGSYLIQAGGSNSSFNLSSPFIDHVTTYHPSSTRDTAAEVTVLKNQEAGGIDIQYRGEKGHSISGTVAGLASLNARSGGISITLIQASTGQAEAGTAVAMFSINRGFAFYGIPDGEYEIYALSFVPEKAGRSPGRRVKIKGADVTGIELTLTPFGSLTGQVVFEAAQPDSPATECKSKRAAFVEEFVVVARRDEKKDPKDKSRTPARTSEETAPNEKGEFLLRYLEGSRHRLEARFLDERLYVRSITLPPPANGNKPIDATRDGVTTRAGELVKGLVITVAEGAAGLMGKVVPAGEGKLVSGHLTIHLVPAERERFDETLRYMETVPQPDGSFKLTGIAPGRYWVVARPRGEEEPGAEVPRLAAWDAEERAKLRSNGEAAGTVIELKPCQTISDYLLRYAPAAAPAKKKTL
jgi:hypothetical protein